MFSLSVFKLSCTSKWLIIIPTLFLAYLFFHLGQWQLERAQEKKSILNQYHDSNTQSPKIWQISDNLPMQYQKLLVHGKFLDQFFLLDNQFHNHQIGYNVISLLQLSNKKILLVDRGWVAVNNDRNILPQVKLPKERLSIDNFQIIGNAYYPPQKSLVLGNIFEKKQNNTQVIEKIDLKLLSKSLHKSIYPFIIRLDKKANDNYIRDWPIVSMPPQRHYAYAVQWLMLSGLAVILSIVMYFRKN